MRQMLIAVKSCARDLACHQPIRDTWGKVASNVADVRFFVGEGVPIKETDEISLSRAPDDYRHLSTKVNEILHWALEREYQTIVLVDTDTFIVPQALFQKPWADVDYAGMLLPWEGGFMFGGCGFALSRDAARIVVNNDIQDPMDDISIGKILLHRPQPDIRVASFYWNRTVGWHFPKNTYAAKNYSPLFPWMDMMAQRHLGKPYHPHNWYTSIGGSTRVVTLELTREDREAL